jgi:hypothetical protein
MKRLVLGLLTLSLIVSLNSCSSEDEKSQEVQKSNKSQEIEKPQSSPIKISLKNGYVLNTPAYGVATYINIISLSDNLTVKKVIVNKGNCKIYTRGGQYYKDNPKKLAYGRKLTLSIIPSRCSLLRINVVTNQGDWSVEY